MKKKTTINDIFKFRGQILLTEKMKGKTDCHCGLCESPTLGHERGKTIAWYDAEINKEHYDSINLFIPMSKTKFNVLRKDYEKSFLKKEAYKRQLTINKNLKNHYFKAKKEYSKLWRLFPLSKEVYDEFAKYIYNKFGEPKFKKQNISGVNWGQSVQKKYATRKYSVWTHSRTIGVQLNCTKFEFSVDDMLYPLPTKTKNEWRQKNTKKFSKKSGKLI